MPRTPRFIVPEQTLHIIQRGNNRTACFAAAADYQRYWYLLLAASRKSGCAVHAYVFMTNHVHLLVTPAMTSSPGRMMHAIGTADVRYFNARYRRTGTLWEGRYRSSLIDSDRYFFACSRYIELNPVRAQMIGQPGEYQWSSFRHNTHDARDPLITPHALYAALSTDAAQRRSAYRSMFDVSLEIDVVRQIRSAGHRGAVLGDDGFRTEIERRVSAPFIRRRRTGRTSPLEAVGRSRQ